MLYFNISVEMKWGKRGNEKMVVIRAKNKAKRDHKFCNANLWTSTAQPIIGCAIFFFF
jgi:hypothetical protein